MPASSTDKIQFLREFVALAKKAQDPLIPVWNEVLQNYLVEPPFGGSSLGNTAYPLVGGREVGRGFGNATYLKSTETKQAIDTLLAKLMLALFGVSNKNYIAARKVGREDATGAETATRLIKYTLTKEQGYRALYGWLKEMLLFGTGIVRATWHYEERPRTLRDFDVDAEGLPVTRTERLIMPYYDDVRLRNVDITRFYPDPGYDNLTDMKGCAEGFDITAYDAMKRAKTGMYSMEAVKEAIREAVNAEDARRDPRQSWRRERPQVDSHPGFKKMQGFEYWGEVPWATDDNERWRVITVIGNQVVRDIPWPLDDYRLPFYDATIGWIPGRFYGVSPGADIRYHQDFLDFMMMMTADSVSRAVRPPIIHKSDDEFNRQKLQSWSPDALVGMDHPEAARTLPYSANLQAGFALMQNLANSAREGSAATGAIQGLGLGINRASATEADRTFRNALDRPELIGQFVESVCLPPMGKGIFSLCRQEISEMPDPVAELTDRIGQMPDPVSLANISGDYDVEFIGSRQHQDLQSKLAGVDRVFQLLQIPQAGNLVDMEMLVADTLEALGYHKQVEKLADPMKIMQNLLIAQLAGAGGAPGANGNGEVQNVPDAATGIPQQAGDVIVN